MMYQNKKVLVTGGTGLIGRQLVALLLQADARVRVASLDEKSRCPEGAEFIRGNLMHWDFCQKIVKDIDYVFNLAGVKGSPAMTSQKPASFFVPIISMNTNVMEAARQAGVDRFLYTSSVGVYSPAEVFYEDDVWTTFPSENDKFAGWAKRMGELQAEAYKIEYGWDKIAIVRPANVYGPYDNFDPNTSMVIPALVKRAIDGENPLVVWGDGSPIRDFIHAKDVARGMMLALENITGQPINLGSGSGVAIRRIVEIIIDNLEIKPEVAWDASKPSGDIKRLMDTNRARAIGFEPSISIEDGIKEVMNWYRENRDIVNKRYNVFNEDKLA